MAEPEVRRAGRMLSTFLIGFAASESGGRFSVTAEQLDADLAWFGQQLIGAIAPPEEQRGARPGDCAQRGETEASTSAMKDM